MKSKKNVGLSLVVASISLFAVLFSLLIPEASAQVSTTLEDFEPYTVGALPCTPTSFTQPCTTAHAFTYSHSSGAFQVSNARDDGAGSNSFQSGGSSFLTAPAGTEFCSTSIDVAVSNIPATGGSVFFTIGGATSTGSITQTTYSITTNSLTVGGSASVYLTAQRYSSGSTFGAAVSTGALTFTTSYSATAFYHFSIYCPATSAGGQFVIASPEATALGNAPQTGTIATNPGTSFVSTKSVWLYNGVYYDNIRTITPPSAIGAIATASHTNIKGFDADPDFNNIILRRGGLTNPLDTEIRSLNPANLATIYTDNTECNNINGVVALGEGLGYYDCTAQDIERFKLISASGADFPLDNCINTCPSPTTFDIDDLDGDSIEDGFDDIATLYLSDNVASGISDSSSCSGGSDLDTRIHAFNFFISGRSGGASDVNGKVISFAPFFKEADCLEDIAPDAEGDGHDVDILAYTSGSISDICSSHNAVEKLDYAVDDTAVTKGFTVSDSATIDTFPNLFYDTEITNTYTAPGSLNGATDIACSGGEILVGTPTMLYLVDPTSGSILSSRAITNLNSVALSYDGNWASYTDTVATYILNTTDLAGTPVAQITNPTGVPFETIIDYFGQRELIATDSVIALYDIHTATTVVPVGHNNTAPSSSSTASSSGSSNSGTDPPAFGPSEEECGDTILMLNIPFLANNFGISQSAMRWLVGLLILSIIVWIFAKTGSPIVIAVGVIVGVAINIAFCAFPIWLLLILVLLIALMVGDLFFNRNDGS